MVIFFFFLGSPTLFAAVEKPKASLFSFCVCVLITLPPLTLC